MMKGGTKMAMYERVGGQAFIGQVHATGGVHDADGALVSDVLNLLSEEDAVRLLNVARKATLDAEARITSLNRTIEMQRAEASRSRRRFDAVEEALKRMVRDEEIDASTAAEIAEAAGVEIKMQKRVTGTLSFSALVEWEPGENEPEADEVADTMYVESHDYEVEEYAVDDTDEDYEV